ncbi:UMP-CMP kinase [Rhynchospora pubera]|uniref:UMP-CMP kinase n=1 Tax=Rhynchospora pubera TaxID=906938 RepID=A0AAV8CWK6_9POAL|nr:UMP-CMP kinase [Rhynchospora pubera]
MGTVIEATTISDINKDACGNLLVDKKVTVIFVLGGPGSGKGTQCANIVEHYGFTHLSAGDLLRAEIKSGSENGTMIQNMIKEGKIVPSEVTIKLLQTAMLISGNDKFLIDGFPRNEENRAAFERVTGIIPEFILFFECSEEEMEKRLLGRNQGRFDDNIETIRKRFKVFVESSLPVVEYYDSLGKVKKIDAAKSITEVFEDVKVIFSSFAPKEACRSLLCDKKVTVIFVLGGPGSGKGTQCSNIVEHYGFTHLSAGDLLRAEIKSGSENGTMIQNMIKEGKIVPSEVIIKLLQTAILESRNDKFLIDGFPRNEENRAAFERVTGITPEFVLFFECLEEEMERRLLGRNQGRVDDNIETIRKRFKVFVESSLPVVEYYDSLGKVKKIDAAKSITEVFDDVKVIFSSFALKQAA